MGRGRESGESQKDPKDELTTEDWEKLGEASEEIGDDSAEDGDGNSGESNDETPAVAFKTEKEFQAEVDRRLKSRLQRERDNEERRRQAAEAKAREDALKENEEFKDLAEERAKRIETLEQQTEELSNTITSMRKDAAVNSKLSEAGVNQKRLAAVMRFVDMSKLEVDEEGNVTGLDDVVKEAKEEFPEGFKASAEERPGGSPASPGAADSGATDQRTDKEAEAEARQLTRSSL